MTLTRLFLFFYIFFSCSSSYEETISQVEPPWGYVFTEWNGAPIDVITYIPPNATPSTPILIVIPEHQEMLRGFTLLGWILQKKIIFLLSPLEQKRVFSQMSTPTMLEA